MNGRAYILWRIRNAGAAGDDVVRNIGIDLGRGPRHRLIAVTLARKLRPLGIGGKTNRPVLLHALEGDFLAIDEMNIRGRRDGYEFRKWWGFRNCFR